MYCAYIHHSLGKFWTLHPHTAENLRKVLSCQNRRGTRLLMDELGLAHCCHDRDEDSEFLRCFSRSRGPVKLNAASFSLFSPIRTLCDITGSGKLNPEQFALSMHLIQQKIKGVELPTQLTPEMVPPSMRTHAGVDPAAFGVRVSHLLAFISLNPLGPRPPVTTRSFALPQNPRPPGSGWLADDPNQHLGLCK